MLMAAGLGTRLKPFTEMKPKALLPLMGVPMAQFAVDTLVRAGVRKVVANVHHMADVATAELPLVDLGGAQLVISDESDLLLGSAGGLRKAAPHFGSEPFFLLNADVLCDIDLHALAAAHLRLVERWGVTMTLALSPGLITGGQYREVQFDAERGLITGLGELAVGKPFFVGAAVLTPSALSSVPKTGPSEFVPTILLPAIDEGRAGAFVFNGNWHDVGNPALWLDTHVALIEALETGRGLLPEWRRRIEEINRRVGDRAWVSQDAPKRLDVADWAGPVYWNALGDETARAPEGLGPRSVLYGPIGEKRLNPDSVGYRGAVVRVR